MINIDFDGHKSFSDWGLMLEYMEITFPEPRENKLVIPGADGVLDLSDSLSPISYDEREVRFIFSIAGNYDDWHKRSSDIANLIHGKTIKIVIDTDRTYYYVGRVKIESANEDDTIEDIVITGMVDPFKYELNDGTEPWQWGTFSFKDGIIRNYSNISVSGAKNIKIIGRKKRVIPVITCSAPMTLIYNRLTIRLPTGSTKVYELQLGEGEHTLSFAGNGTITIAYRGGCL